MLCKWYWKYKSPIESNLWEIFLSINTHFIFSSQLWFSVEIRVYHIPTLNWAHSVGGSCLFVNYTSTNFLIVTCYLLPRVIFGFRFLCFLSTQRHKVAEYFFTNTDISDNTEVNHERKRDSCVACWALRKIPLIWLICVQKKKKRICLINLKL